MWTSSKEISLKSESGCWRWEPHVPTTHCYLQHPKQEEMYLVLPLWKKVIALLVQQEKGRFSLCPTTRIQPIRDYYNSANKKPLEFKLPVFSLFITALWISFSFYKRIFLSLVSPDLYHFCYSMLVLNYNFLLLWINSFCWWNNFCCF